MILSAAPGWGAPSIPDLPIVYPSSVEVGDLIAWLHRETDIPPESVVAVTPDQLVAVMQTQPTVSPPGFAVTIRSEALNPDTTARDHVVSWHATYRLDCQGRRVLIGEVTGYAARNLLFEGKTLHPARPDWSPLVADDLSAQIWASRCESGFQAPLLEPRSPLAALEPPPEPGSPASREAGLGPSPARASPSQAQARTVSPPEASVPARNPPGRAGADPRLGLRPSIFDDSHRSSAVAAGLEVQIIAAETEGEAQRALLGLRAEFPALMAGKSTRVVTIRSDGRVFHRGLISGFSRRAEALSYCRQLVAARRGCFLRPDASATPAP